MSSLKCSAAALAIATLLAGCGGGSDSSASADVTPAVAVASLRARIQSAPPKAAAATAVTATPTEAAEQLLDYGEANYSDLFPEQQPSQVFGPFRYRAYSNGIYLGVVVADTDPGYAVGAVYVMGRQFGSVPMYVAPLTNYITPVPGPDPDSAGNGCYDLNLLDTEGTRTVIAYQYSGPVTGNVTLDTLTGATTSFEGQQARLLTTKATGSTTSSGSGGQAVTVDTETRTYQRRTAQSEITNYGNEMTTPGTVGNLPSTAVAKTIWSPAWADRQFALTEGQSLIATQSGAISTTTTVTGLPPATSTSSSYTEQTVKLLGHETLVVPAGTYSTCKFRITRAGVAGMTTQWVIVGKGLMVKSVATSGATTQTVEATSVTLNGQKL
jgi:hypothetical protein